MSGTLYGILFFCVFFFTALLISRLTRLPIGYFGFPAFLFTYFLFSSIEKRKKGKSESANQKHLLEVFSRSIDMAEEETRPVASCKNELTKAFSAVLRQNADEVRSFGARTDYQRIAWAWISSLSFDLLSSGHYHIHRGKLSQTGEALYSVYRYTMNHARDEGRITTEQLEDQLDYLAENISSVG